jgi:predicted RNA binding protein YcfA (HicA-like mRNA interferase family)
MSNLGPVSRRELIRRFRALGFQGPYQEGKHAFMFRSELRIPIPNPHEGDIGVGLLSAILRLSGISRALGVCGLGGERADLAQTLG